MEIFKYKVFKIVGVVNKTGDTSIFFKNELSYTLHSNTKRVMPRVTKRLAPRASSSPKSRDVDVASGIHNNA